MMKEDKSLDSVNIRWFGAAAIVTHKQGLTQSLQ
jgi:hypothetical protein